MGRMSHPRLFLYALLRVLGTIFAMAAGLSLVRLADGNPSPDAYAIAALIVFSLISHLAARSISDQPAGKGRHAAR